MADALPPDPFTICYARLFDVLTEFDDFKANFKLDATRYQLGNWLRLDGAEASAKAGVKARLNAAPGDLPQVHLLQDDYHLMPGENSTTAGITQNYRLVFLARDLNVAKLNVLKFTAFRALCAAGNHLGMPKLVRGWRLAGAADDAYGQRQNQGGGRGQQEDAAQRWTTAATVEVLMTIKKTDLAAGVVPTT